MIFKVKEMKNDIIVAVAAVFLVSSCGTYTGSRAYTGGTLGSILGSAIGGIAGGARGSDVGTIIGMAGERFSGPLSAPKRTNKIKNKFANITKEYNRTRHVAIIHTLSKRKQQRRLSLMRVGSTHLTLAMIFSTISTAMITLAITVPPSHHLKFRPSQVSKIWPVPINIRQTLKSPMPGSLTTTRMGCCPVARLARLSLKS